MIDLEKLNGNQYPKILHRLWLGPKTMPDTYVAFGEKWKSLNPDWKIYEWDYDSVLEEAVICAWTNQNVIDDIRSRSDGGSGQLTVEAAVQIADVLGYEIVHRYGGIYVNTDIEPLRPLSYLYDFHEPRNNAFACNEDYYTDRVVNAVLGGPVGHPFWAHVIEMLSKYYWHNPLAEMVATTGPQLLTDCANRWQGKQNKGAGFQILAARAFNEVHWDQIAVGENADGKWGLLEGMVGVHHWGHKLDGRTNLVR